MKTRPDLVDTAIRHIQQGSDGSIGTIRVDAVQTEQLRYEVSLKESAGHRLVVDEPAHRGERHRVPRPWNTS